MYRSQGAVGVLKGVLSGPYTGGAREIDVSRLSRGHHERLTESLAGRGEAAAFLGDHGGRAFSTRLERMMIVGGATGLVGLWLVGYGERASRFGLHPWSAVLIWLALAGVVSAGLLSTLRRRSRNGRGSLQPGRYLLPLDLVEVLSPEENGRQMLRVTPLGDARDGRIEGRQLHLTFADGTATNLWIGSRDAEPIMRRLEHTQTLLEDLTFNADLERRVAADPFFELRVDGSWSQVAPEGEHVTARRRLHGGFGTGVAAVAALAVGTLGFGLRNRFGDDALYLQALHDNTPEALDVYLAHGSVRHATEARGIRDVLAKAREKRDVAGEPRMLNGSGPEERQRALDNCLATLRARSSAAHPEVTRIMEGLVERASATGERKIPIRFSSTVDPLPSGVPMLDLEAREITVAWAFERVFSESCPAAIIGFARRPSGGGPGLDVRYTVSWPGVKRTVPTAAGELEVSGMQITFDVALHGVDKKAAFALTLPPPERPAMELRPRSLFLLGGAPPKPGVFDERVYRVMTARAFDRLYDEMFGLFFSGDVRVPLRESESTSLMEWK